ncbi:MAG: hypothetical protein KC468_29340 [Myxococcales bacterium]|nr:hypothetical protein [Myxococcales bacterium]
MKATRRFSSVGVPAGPPSLSLSLSLSPPAEVLVDASLDCVPAVVVSVALDDDDGDDDDAGALVEDEPSLSLPLAPPEHPGTSSASERENGTQREAGERGVAMCI